MVTPSLGRVTACERYKKLAEKREPYLRRAKDVSMYTLPRLYPKDGASESTVFYKPWQSFGAQGVSGFASKLTLSLLPPNRRPFRLEPKPKVAQKLEAEGQAIGEDVSGEVLQALSNLESTIHRQIEARGHRRALNAILQHLQVSGNAAVDLGVPTPKVYSLNQFVCVRDREGNLLELVLKESVARSALSEEVIQKINLRNQNDRDKQNLEEYDIYTWIKLDKNWWKIHQEVEDIEIPRSQGRYPKESPRFLALRWGRVDGEHYGRSLGEDNIGDITAVEALQRSVTSYALAAAKLLYLVNPGGVTDIADVIDAESGAVRPGRAEDITVPQINKQLDLAAAQDTLNILIQRLSTVFLMTVNLRRDAERVTAEEIRLIANEADATNAGIYSTLAAEYQLPLIRWIKYRMETAKELPPLPDDIVDITIIGGIDALGRTADLQALDEFVGGAAQIFGPEVLQYIKVPNYLRRRAAALSQNGEDLVRSEQEIQEKAAEAQNAALMQKAAPNVVNAVAGAVQNPVQ
jgi:hypothetical protein